MSAFGLYGSTGGGAGAADASVFIGSRLRFCIKNDLVVSGRGTGMDFRQYLAELRSRPIPKEMAFSEAEYRARVGKIRGYMAEKKLDALLVTEVPNVSYLSGFETFVPNNFACLILPGEGEPTLQVAEFEIPGALLNSWVEDVRATRFNDPAATASEFAAILEQHKLDRKRIGIESRLNGFTIEIYERLKLAVPNASFVDASDLVFRARLVKSAGGARTYAQAADIVRPALDETLASIRTGMSENEIAAVAYAALARRGSEYFSCQPCVMAAHRAGWIHTSQRGARIAAGTNRDDGDGRLLPSLCERRHAYGRGRRAFACGDTAREGRPPYSRSRAAGGAARAQRA